MGRYIRKSPKQKRYVYTGRGILARLKEQILNIKKMENKINIAELLKDCPKGMELYSPIFGKVYLDKIRPHLAIVVTIDKEQGDLKEEFLYDGRYGMNGECMLFPSKGKTTWEGFQRPFKDGDVVAIGNSNKNSQIFIFKEYIKEDYAECYMMLDDDGSIDIECGDYYVERLATEEEKQKLFDAIKANGYKWNEETKTLEKLVEPKFKAGDKIVSKNKRDEYFHILHVAEHNYILNIKGYCLEFKDQDNFDLVPDKFDVSTLKPFDKVLVRDNDEQMWTADMFSFYNEKHVYPFMCVGHYTNQCIPYDQNKHLLGTTNKCDDYYKNWK